MAINERDTLSDPRRRRRRFRLDMNGSAMKIYGCAAMLFYTISRSVIQNGVIGVGSYGPGELAEAMKTDPHLMMLSSWASAFQLIGGLALPVFAFLLVEGFVHTSSFKRYLLLMLGFAIVSEAPYDLAMSGTWWDMSGQNLLFTYALCLIMLYGLRLLGGYGEKKGAGRWLGQLCVVLATGLWSLLLSSAFGLVSVALTAIYYLLYEKRGVGVLLGCAVSITYVTAPLSGYAVWNYDGQRGKLAARCKYLFYALYPLHLLALGLIARAVAG